MRSERTWVGSTHPTQPAKKGDRVSIRGEGGLEPVIKYGLGGVGPTDGWGHTLQAPDKRKSCRDTKKKNRMEREKGKPMHEKRFTPGASNLGGGPHYYDLLSKMLIIFAEKNAKRGHKARAGEPFSP